MGENQSPGSFIFGPFIAIGIVTKDSIWQIIGLSNIQNGGRSGLDDVGVKHGERID